MPAAAQALDIKDVADEIERLGFVVGQEEKKLMVQGKPPADEMARCSARVSVVGLSVGIAVPVAL